MVGDDLRGCVKVKNKLTVEEATTAKRGSRGITLLFP
jgi:hypothetical protein